MEPLLPTVVGALQLLAIRPDIGEMGPVLVDYAQVDERVGVGMKGLKNRVQEGFIVQAVYRQNAGDRDELSDSLI